MNGEFIDTNILVYAHDSTGGAKRDTAQRLLSRLFDEDSGAASIQVLSEFYSVCTRKVPLGPEKAEQVIADMASWNIHSPTHADLIRASQLHRRHHIAWWDALLVTSAMELGCSILWTEDFSDGRRFGTVTVRNPFRQA